MSLNPLVSIIVNNYNYGHFLRHAVDSALTQSYHPTEVIVVDDGSTDNSREILSTYSDQVCTIFQQNGGQASAFNSGFRASRGEIIIFLDADDVLLPEAVENVVPAFVDDSIVSVSWPLWVIDTCGKRNGQLKPSGKIISGRLRDRVIKNGPLSGPFSPTSGNAWSRIFLERVMPVRDSGDKHGGDAYLTTLAPLFGKMTLKSRPLAEYRVHGRNFSPPNAYSFIQRDLRRFEYQCSLLSEHLILQGAAFESANWRAAGSSYTWMHDMLAVKAELNELIPAKESFILIDDNLLDSDFFPGHNIYRIMEKDGVYWGPPQNDLEAIEQVRRLTDRGASYFILLSYSYWWLEYYHLFHDWLALNFQCIKSDRLLTVFDLATR